MKSGHEIGMVEQCQRTRADRHFQSDFILDPMSVSTVENPTAMRIANRGTEGIITPEKIPVKKSANQLFFHVRETATGLATIIIGKGKIRTRSSVDLALTRYFPGGVVQSMDHR